MRKTLTRTVDPLRDTAQQLLYIEIFCERRCVNMEKYAKAQMEVIELENEDVITESIPIENCPYDGGCKVDSLFCTPDGSCAKVMWAD